MNRAEYLDLVEDVVITLYSLDLKATKALVRINRDLEYYTPTIDRVGIDTDTIKQAPIADRSNII